MDHQFAAVVYRRCIQHHLARETATELFPENHRLYRHLPHHPDSYDMFVGSLHIHVDRDSGQHTSTLPVADDQQSPGTRPPGTDMAGVHLVLLPDSQHQGAVQVCRHLRNHHSDRIPCAPGTFPQRTDLRLQIQRHLRFVRFPAAAACMAPAVMADAAGGLRAYLLDAERVHIQSDGGRRQNLHQFLAPRRPD